MNRRFFVTAAVGIFGTAVSSKVMDIEAPLELNSDDATYSFVYRHPHETEVIFGRKVAEKLWLLRSRFFESGKLIQLSQGMEKNPNSPGKQLITRLKFDSNTSRDEYLEARMNLLKGKKLEKLG